MEEIIPILRDMLKEVTEIKLDKENLVLTIIVNPKTEIKGILADSNEVKTMFHMFAGLKEDIPMNIIVDNEYQTIYLKFQTMEDLNKIKVIMDIIWDKTVDLLEQVISGDLNGLNDIREVDD